MNQLSKINMVRWAVVLFYLLTIVMNYISQVMPFNGQTNGEVSDKYATLVTPADYAFSIWGVIYLSLGIYVLYQALWASPGKKEYDKIGKWLILSFVTSTAWLPAFQYEQLALSVLIMLIILFSLISIAIVLVKNDKLEKGEKRWIKIPFGLYLGWICVATIVNIAVLAKYSNPSLLGITELTWFWIMLAVGFVLAIIISNKSQNGVIALVFVWAYLAIGFKENQGDAIFTYTVSAAILLFIVAFFIIYRQYKLR